jgi:hypothetical protein
MFKLMIADELSKPVVSSNSVTPEVKHKVSGVYFLEIEMEEEELKIVKIVLEK